MPWIGGESVWSPEGTERPKTRQTVVHRHSVASTRVNLRIHQLGFLGIYAAAAINNCLSFPSGRFSVIGGTYPFLMRSVPSMSSLHFGSP